LLHARPKWPIVTVGTGIFTDPDQSDQNGSTVPQRARVGRNAD